MEFDDAKENIQPLAAGRNASILQAALQAQSPQELQHQRRQYENAIQNYEGDDPLEPWFEYIYWIEQSYPSGGKESGLEEVLLKCLTLFEKDEKYHQDRRMIKLYIKYIDTHENPRECYQQLYNQGIGTMVADLYICWAYYYDLSGNFRKADQIFRMGIECRAQPLEELKEAHQHFGFTMSQRILYDDDNSKKLYQSSLQEKRHALTSLKSHKKKVGSVRTGWAIKSQAPGKVQLNSANANTSSRGSGNSNLQVFEDENQDPNAIPLTDPAPGTAKSVVKTILDSARKQENVKEPGPWNKAHDKKKGKLFASEPRTDLGFEILEDEDNPQIVKGPINYGKPFIMFDGFVTRNKRQEEWNLPVTLENELVPRSYPAYDKCLLYPTSNSEYSPEELRGYRWFKRRNIENTFTQRYDMVWKNCVDAGIRMYPNFVRKNLLIQEEPLSEGFDPFEKVASGNSRLVFDLKSCYPSEEEEELQFEEVMYHRWKNGERKLKYGGNETIAFTEEMEETVCLPSGASRRKSFFPVNRKSIAPSQFCKLPTSLEDSEEDEMVAPKTPAPRKSVILQTPKKFDFPKSDCTNEGSDEAFEFKAPAAPPMKQQKLNFQIYEEEESNYEGNETCSTQVFNCFLKAQSASTPNPPNKTTKLPLVDKQPTALNFSGIENVPVPTHSISTPVFALPEDIDVGLTLQGKHLSTIMETSEQLTGNTASTKSSIGSPDNEIEGQQSRIPLINNACTLETVEEAGSLAEKNSAEIQLMKSLRLEEELPVLRQHAEISRLEKREDTAPNLPTIKIFEDKTETVPKMLFTKAGNFSRLEEKEDTVPFAKSVKFCEEKTETITKMILAPKAVGHLPPEDEMLDFFAKSPEKQMVSPINPQNTHTSQQTQAEKSILTASAFMNFNDSPLIKQKCNYDSPELRAKWSLLKKPSNVSFLPNFDDTMECDEEKNKACTANDLSASLLKTKPESYPTEHQKQACGGGAIKKQKSTQDSFMSGFPSVTAGINKPLEDSFMSYLSSASGPVSKQAVEDSFMKKFNTGSGNARKALDNSRQVDPPAVNAADNSSPIVDLAGKSFKMFENSFLPQSTATVKQNEDSFMPDMSAIGDKQDQAGALLSLKRSYIAGDNSLPLNVSKNVAASKTSYLGTSFMPNMASDSSMLHQKSKLITGDMHTPESIRKEGALAKESSQVLRSANESSMGSSSMRMENSIKSTKVAFLASKNDTSMLKSRKTTSPQHQKPSKIPHFQQKFDTNTSQPQPNSTMSFLNSFSMTESKKLPNTTSNLSAQNIETPKEHKKQQKSESQPNSTLSFLNSFSMTESKKISNTEPQFLGSQNAEPTKEPQKLPDELGFTIFEDSSYPDKTNRLSVLKNASSQKVPPTEPIKQSDQQQQFTIFEDSNCRRMSSEIKNCPDKGPSFNIFEDSTCKRPSSISGDKASEITMPKGHSMPRASAPQTNKSVCFDASIRVDDFFEDNIRTEAFAPNLSMIRNSTWLPNHNPRQSQIKEQSLHIKEEGDFSNTPQSSRGLSIFSTVPQEKSVDLMPPPPLPAASFKPSKVKIVSSPPQAPIEIAESDDEDEGSADQSIYYKKTPKTPGISRHAWVPDADEQTPELNAFIHRQVCLETTQQAIDEYCVSDDVNPFNRDLQEAFLLQIEFTNYIEKLETCGMVRRVRPLKKDTTICINGKTFNITKLIAEGGYGAVYSGTDTQSGKAFAFKQERPANLWEYYVCLELHSRLHNTEILSGFMNIEYALIGNNASILVSQLSRYGSLIAVCNKIKKETRKNVDEYVVMHLTSQLLLIMDHLHASNIIHADIKADNFLLMEKLVPGRKQPTIQLIDFGTSIDMDLFPKGQTFTYTHETESFKCPEMHDKRPWTYQLDLFGLAGVVHVLLFGKYMEIYKKPSGWSHKTHVPRYFNKSLWETIFHSLLNVHDCYTMPNLQNLRACLEEEIAEKDKVVCQKISEFNRALDL